MDDRLTDDRLTEEMDLWEPFVETNLVRFRDGRFMTTDELGERVFANNLYQVNVTVGDPDAGMDGAVWLSIKRLDKTATHDWRHFQRIKNEMVGVERWAMEVYPSESRLVDTSDQFHLWVMPAGSEMPPWMFPDRLVAEKTPEMGGSQRPFAKSQRPPDTLSPEELQRMVDEYGPLPGE